MARQHIVDLRKLRNLSQAALGRAAGLTSSEISRIECGYRDMAENEAVAIAKALDVLPAKIDPRLLKVIKPVGMAAANVPPASVAPIHTPPSARLEDDPSNFRELPDERLLASTDPVGTNIAERRQRLADALKRATQILHTPKVPASVWRAWRDFERRVQEELREQGGRI